MWNRQWDNLSEVRWSKAILRFKNKHFKLDSEPHWQPKIGQNGRDVIPLSCPYQYLGSSILYQLKAHQSGLCHSTIKWVTIIQPEQKCMDHCFEILPWQKQSHFHQPPQIKIKNPDRTTESNYWSYLISLYILKLKFVLQVLTYDPIIPKLMPMELPVFVGPKPSPLFFSHENVKTLSHPSFNILETR